MSTTILTYFFLTGIANIFLNCWLLHIVEEPRTTDFATNFGIVKFYLISFAIGCVMIPIIILYVIWNFLKR